jgi:hypothetical protein
VLKTADDRSERAAAVVAVQERDMRVDTLDAGGLELPAGAPVPFNRLRDGSPHNGIIARCGFASHRGLDALLRWPRKPL